MKPALTVAAITISALLLVRSLKRGRRPTVVREVLDAIRTVLQVAAVVAVVVITGVRSSPALLIGALIAGAASGAYVGSTLQLDIQGRRCVAQRSLAGAAVWSVGLIAAQLAGLANRAGVLRVGQAISWFGLGVALGTLLGRTQRIDRVRKQLAVGTMAGLVLVVTFAAAFSRDDTTAKAAPPGNQWTLDQVVRGTMDGFTSMSHDNGVISAHIQHNTYNAYFNASYEPPPTQLIPGETLNIHITASASADGSEQQFSAFDVIQYVASGWTGAAVTVSVGCEDPIGDAPLTCSQPDSNEGTFTWEIPAAAEGQQFAIGIGLLNCDCSIFWVYEPELAAVTDSVVDGQQTPVDAPDDSEQTDSTADAAAADDETVTDDEALGTSIAVILIAVLIGLVDLAETPAPLRPPPDPARIEAMADQADRWAIDAIVGGIDFEGVTDEIRAIRERARNGQSQPGDEEMLRAIRDALWAIGERDRAGDAATSQHDAAILGAFETMLAVEAEFGKAAAGTFGPTSATLYAGFVETVANRDKGLANALGHGAIGGASALVGSRTAPTLNTWGGIIRAGGQNAANNAAEDIGHQMVDAGGDVSKLDPTRTAGAAGIGFVTGSGGAAVRGAGGVDLPPPAPRAGGGFDPPRPPLILPEEGVDVPVVRGPSPADALNPPHGSAPVDVGRAPADLFPDAPELGTMPRWPRNSDGAFLDPGGKPLFTMSPEGPRDLDGNPIARVITDSSNRPIGFERTDGVQVISSSRYDPGAFDTVGGQPPAPDDLPPTGQQPRP